MANKANQFNYLIAFQWMKNGIDTVNCLETEEIDNEIIILSQNNPEKEVIKRQEFEKLSCEAKEIIDIILNAPQDIIQLFTTPKQQRISQTMLKSMLSQTWKSKFIVENAIQEIKAWVKTL